MTRNSRLPMAALAVLLALPLSLSAQVNGGLSGLEGKKVRLRSAIVESDLRGAMVVNGTVFEVRGDSIHVMQENGLPAHLPLSSIRTLDVHDGKDHARGAWRGAVVGATVGLALSLIPPDCHDGYGLDCRSDGSAPTYVEYAWSNVAAFATLGSMFGAFKGTDRWNSVITPQRLTVAPAKGGGIRVGLVF